MNQEPAPGGTFFARAGRTEPEELRRQVDQIVNSPVMRAVLTSLDGYVVVLNGDRQILAANDDFLEALRREGIADPRGLRWGEANHCVHVPEGPDGCGTAPACRYCGAALGILAAQEGQSPALGECRMSIRKDGRWEAREFQVRATALDLPFGEVLIPVFHDVSDTHRRELLEASFLHDLGNMLSALSCWSALMTEGGVDLGAAAARITAISADLADVVGHQRVLLQAERGELPVEPQVFEAEPFLAALARSLAAHPAARAKDLQVRALAGPGAAVRSDPVLLLRILSNMGINALEAAETGATISLSFQLTDGRPRFSVHNPGVIGEAVAAQIFQRSFSTKAKAGRGLGTYAMKILGENVLGGTVAFTSTADAGTEFHIQL